MKTPLGLRVFVAVVIFCVVLAVGYGIYLVGSPAKQRLIRLDEKRVTDLQNIAAGLRAYWEGNGKLPDELEELQSERYFVQSIRDPETGELYEYHGTGGSSYQLCAVFAAKSSQDQARYPAPVSTWAHEAGRACFDEDANPTTPVPPVKLAP